MMTDLGKLVRVPLRDIWASEASDFTPWLAREENIVILGETIGLDLEVEAQEKSVGPFRADILCKNLSAAGEEWVLIENQLERTDHTHMGQLMTYAAGLDAVTIVWVAERFTEEHRAALDWLNGITEENFRFFGLEIELWKIGDSQTAPKFNMVCKPNDWSKATRRAAHGEMTPGQQLQIEFWTLFTNLLADKGYSHNTIPHPHPQNWLSYSVGRSDFFIQTIASAFDNERNIFAGELRVELCIRSDRGGEYLRLLEARRDEIKAALGEEVTFYEKENIVLRRLWVRRPVQFDDKSQWSDYAVWLHERLEKFQRLFRPMVADLEVERS